MRRVDDRERFVALNEAGIAKLVLAFAVTAVTDGRSVLVTETRVFCTDRATWRRFAPYWYVSAR